MCSDHARPIFRQPLWLRWISLCQSPLMPLAPGAAAANGTAVESNTNSPGNCSLSAISDFSSCARCITISRLTAAQSAAGIA